MDTIDPTPGMEYLKDYLRTKNQVQILYSQSLITFFFPALSALCLTLVIWDIAVRKTMLIWLVIVVLYSMIRYFLLWQYRSEKLGPDNVNKWLNIFIVSVIISGCVWGIAGIVLIPYDDSNSIEFTLYNGLILLMICGLVSGAVISYSINIWVLISYSFPALIPPAFYLISLGDKYNSAFGGLILLYYFFISVAAFRMNKQFDHYLEMEFRQEKLTHENEYLKNLFIEFRKRNKRQA